MSYTIITPVLPFYKVQTTYLGQNEKKKHHLWKDILNKQQIFILNGI